MQALFSYRCWRPPAGLRYMPAVVHILIGTGILVTTKCELYWLHQHTSQQQHTWFGHWHISFNKNTGLHRHSFERYCTRAVSTSAVRHVSSSRCLSLTNRRPLCSQTRPVSSNPTIRTATFPIYRYWPMFICAAPSQRNRRSRPR